MRITVQRHQGRQPTDVTATAVPVPGLRVRSGPGPAVVSVLGPRHRVAGLVAHLPADWTLRYIADLDEVDHGDLVLLGDPTEREIAAARAVLPTRTRIIALVDEVAAPDLVAEVLTAGADVCVRAGLPVILASHLIGCHRRQTDDQRTAQPAWT